MDRSLVFIFIFWYLLNIYNDQIYIRDLQLLQSNRMIVIKKRSFINMHGLISFGLLSILFSSLLILSFSSVIPLELVSAFFLSHSLSLFVHFSFVRSFVILFKSARHRVNKLNVNTIKRISSTKRNKPQREAYTIKSTFLTILYINCRKHD